MVRKLLFLFLFASSILLAQEEVTPSPLSDYLSEPIPRHLFDTDNWEAAKEGIDYNGSIRADRRDEDFGQDTLGKAETPEERRSGANRTMGPLFTNILYILLIIGAIAIVGIIIAQFLGGEKIKFRRKNKIDSTALNFDIELVEEKLIESDLDRMIREAEEANNYPMALRLQYLAGVKALATSKHIKWKKAKTNRKYLREIKDQNLKIQFRNNTIAYERIWYGDSIITENLYADLKPIFKNFTTEVSGKVLTDSNNS